MDRQADRGWRALAEQWARSLPPVHVEVGYATLQGQAGVAEALDTALCPGPIADSRQIERGQYCERHPSWSADWARSRRRALLSSVLTNSRPSDLQMTCYWVTVGFEDS